MTPNRARGPRLGRPQERAESGVYRLGSALPIVRLQGSLEPQPTERSVESGFAALSS